LLQAEGFDVIAEAPDAATGIEAARMLEPDIALVDIYLPDSDGFELSERLADLATPPMVVLISSREQEEFEPLVERSFARGFVPKHELSRDALEELLE
jgi:DNA-binding NarL/FixJ family response regulator